MFFVVAAAGVAVADQPFDSWASVPPGTPQSPSGNSGSTPAGATEALTFFNDRATFQAAYPGLSLEDFSGTLVPPDSVLSCPPPFNQFTNNSCFGPGAIMPGLSVELIDNGNSGENVVLTPAFLGVNCVTVGPNSFGDDSRIDFDPPIRAAGLDLLSPISGAITFDIEVVGPAGSLGTTTAVSCFTAPCFWGVASDDVGGINSIVFTNAAGEGELFCNVEFGGEPVPVELQSMGIE